MYIKQRGPSGHRQSSQYISYYHSRRCGKQQVKSPTKAFSFLAALTSTVFGYSQLCTCWPAWWRPPCSRTPWPRCPGWRAATTPRWPPCPARGSRVADRCRTRVSTVPRVTLCRASGGRRILRRPGSAILKRLQLKTPAISSVQLQLQLLRPGLKRVRV